MLLWPLRYRYFVMMVNKHDFRMETQTHLNKKVYLPSLKKHMKRKGLNNRIYIDNNNGSLNNSKII